MARASRPSVGKEALGADSPPGWPVGAQQWDMRFVLVSPTVLQVALHRQMSLIELIVISGGDCLLPRKVAGRCVTVVKVRAHLVTTYEPPSVSWAVS